MSKYNGLGKLYDRFTPEERFQLEIDALLRGDEQEVKKLVKSCPRRTYTMIDMDFQRTRTRALHLTMATLMDILPYIAKLKTIAASKWYLGHLSAISENSHQMAYLRGHEAGSRYAWHEAGAEGDAPGYEADESLSEENYDPRIDDDLKALEERTKEVEDLVSEHTQPLETAIAQNALTEWQAFCRFCEGVVGVDARNLLEVFFPPTLEEIAFLEGLCARLEIETDDEVVEERRKELKSHWQEVFRTKER